VKNLTITAAPGKRVVWRAPAGKASAVLVLTNTEGARIVGITFEASPKVDHAVWLNGSCPGLVLEDCELREGAVAALAVHDCVGEPNRPVTVRRCAIRTTAPAAKGAVAFLAEPSRKKPTDGSQYVVVEDCLVEGPAGGAGFYFDGSAGADVRHCRIWKGAAGVQFRRVLGDRLGDLSWKVNVTGNTFGGQTAAGVWVEDAPQLKGSAWNQIAISQNFFAGPAPAIRVDGDAAGTKFLKVAPDNFRKTGTPPGQATNFQFPPPTEIPAEVITDPANPARLLTYDKSSPLRNAAGGKPVGVPPE
jgi:hypothetical protein